MSKVDWIKVNTGIFDDQKIKVIEVMPEADAILVIWLKLLVLAGQVNDQGMIYLTKRMPYNDEMLSQIFNRKVSIIRLALSTFADLEMIEVSDGGLIGIVNWNKHQNIEGMDRIRELNKKRQQEYRERKKALQLTEGATPKEVKNDPNEGGAREAQNERKNGACASAKVAQKDGDEPVDSVKLSTNIDNLEDVTLRNVTVTGETRLDQTRIDTNKAQNASHCANENNFDFDTFWERYNYKKGKQKALKAFNKLSQEDKVNLFPQIENFKKDYKRKNYSLPYPASFLNGRRWEDEIEVQVIQIDNTDLGQLTDSYDKFIIFIQGLSNLVGTISKKEFKNLIELSFSHKTKLHFQNRPTEYKNTIGNILTELDSNSYQARNTTNLFEYIKSKLIAKAA